MGRFLTKENGEFRTPGELERCPGEEPLVSSLLN